MGRPTKYSDEAAQTIVDATREGVPLAHAAALAGIGLRTVYDWLKRGESDDAPEGDAQFVAFAQLYRMALAEYVRGALRGITEARNADLDWKADSWKLSKRCPAEFGERVAHEHSGPNGGPIEVTDARAKLMAILARGDDPGAAGGDPGGAQ